VEELDSNNIYHKQQYKQQQQQQTAIRKNNRDRPVISNQLILGPNFGIVVAVVLNMH